MLKLILFLSDDTKQKWTIPPTFQGSFMSPFVRQIDSTIRQLPTANKKWKKRSIYFSISYLLLLNEQIADQQVPWAGPFTSKDTPNFFYTLPSPKHKITIKEQYLTCLFHSHTHTQMHKIKHDKLHVPHLEN
jgi:hypothetical protein